MSDKIEYWLDLAEYDLETASAMLKTRRYLYVGFMCHQVIEKALKALYVFKKKEVPPYIHLLISLTKKCGIYSSLSKEQINLINALEPMNIEARYPSYKEKLLQQLSLERCKI